MLDIWLLDFYSFIALPFPSLFLVFEMFLSRRPYSAGAYHIPFLPLYLPKFRLQGSFAGSESVQFCFQLLCGRKSGESGLLDLPVRCLEQDDLALKTTQEFFLVL